MKKLMITLAIVLGMGTMAFSQEIESDEDFDASETPLGSGIAVLMGLGAAYLVGKHRKEE